MLKKKLLFVLWLQFWLLFLAIREDRTRGGRSTYQCSYSLPPSLTGHPELRSSTNDIQQNLGDQHLSVKVEPPDPTSHTKRNSLANSKHGVPSLLQVSVTHLFLFFYCQIAISCKKQLFYCNWLVFDKKKQLLYCKKWNGLHKTIVGCTENYWLEVERNY